MRLHLLQGILAYHENKMAEARRLLAQVNHSCSVWTVSNVVRLTAAGSVLEYCISPLT